LLNDMVQAIGEYMGRPVDPHSADPRPGNVPHSMADNSLARAELGYEPVVSWREGLERTIDWYSSRHSAVAAGL
jgi:UDP-glucose 4-epimerase